MPKKKYVIWNKRNRPGEFEFNDKTQDHLFTLKQATAWVAYEVQDDWMSTKSDWVIYELTLTKVKA
jgi:hypothetical protein